MDRIVIWGGERLEGDVQISSKETVPEGYIPKDERSKL